MNRDHTKRLLVILAVSVSTVLAALPTKAQTGVRSPLANTVLAGYGSTTFSAINNDKFVSNFTASVSPVILYSMGSDFLFETELEFGLSGQVTTTSLEYAQIDYLGFERVVVIAGKFLLPFGVFSERLHPTWINKMPNAPVLYGHAHGGVAEGSLMPVLSDAGVLVRYNLPMNNEWTLDLSGWVSQGPVLVSHDDEGDGHDDEGDGHDDEHAGKTGASVETNSVAEIEIPQIGFGIAFDDNNKNKMLGGRIGFVHGPTFEMYVSGFHAMYDPENFLDLIGGNLAMELRRGPMELRGEAILLKQEIQTENGFEFMNSVGYYLQAARRFKAFEAVVRWGHLLESTIMDEVVRSEKKLLALGLNYWIDATIPIKVMYEIDFDGTDRFMVQWAFGF